MTKRSAESDGSRLRTGAWVVAAMVVVAAATRLVPHPSNFTPILAMGLFGGARFASIRTSLTVPLLAMLASDVALEIAYGWGMHALLPVVYACIAASVGIGVLLRRRRGPVAVLAAGVGSSVLFFSVTNFAVWARGALYPLSADGLLQCYVAAVPFFQNTLAGTLFYSAMLFGGHALIERLARGGPAESR